MMTLQELVLYGEKHEVSVLARSPDQKHLAVGYVDGAIRIFSLQTGEVTVTFSGHKSSVNALNYDRDGVRLVSGANVRAFCLMLFSSV